MVNQQSQNDIPTQVRRAMNLAEQMEYSGSPSIETGRLLQLLASQYQSGVIGELATGCGVGTAWINSSLSPATSFFTIDGNEARAVAVQAMFEKSLNVRVMHGSWRDLLESWRFNMLYATYSSQRSAVPRVLVESLREGGLIILDGLPPSGSITLGTKSDADQVRNFWMNNPRVYAVELNLSLHEAVILATRRR